MRTQSRRGLHTRVWWGLLRDWIILATGIFTTQWIYGVGVFG